MYRFLLTPRWWGINLFAVLAVPVCLFMGSWQLSRFEARVDSQQQQEKAVAESSHAEAAPLSRLLPVTTETSGRMAEAEGHYDRAHPLLVPDRELEQKGSSKQGFYVLSLLRTDSGKAVPVVRGWLPGKADPDRVPDAPRGEVTVSGAVQASESPRSPGVSAQGLPEGQIGMLSAAALVNVVSYDVDDAWMTVQKPSGTDSGLKPVPPAAAANTGLDMKAFQNLGYTAEWFVFAGFVVFMWFRFFRREAELARDAALGLHPEDTTPPTTPEPITPVPTATSASDGSSAASEASADTEASGTAGRATAAAAESGDPAAAAATSGPAASVSGSAEPAEQEDGGAQSPSRASTA